MALGVDQIEALIEKTRALAMRERKRIDALEKSNEDVVQEICTSLTVPASAFGMSYARAYYGERASVLGIPIDARVGLFMHGIGALFGLTASKGGQKLGKFFGDIANGAFASWTAALGAAYGAKKRIETPMPASQPTVNTVGLSQETPMRTSGPMTQEELAAITAAMSTPTNPAQTPNVGTADSVQGPPARPAAPMDYGHLAAITAAMSAPPPMPQQQAPAYAQPAAPQPAPIATTAAPATAPPPMPSEAPKKLYRFVQSMAAPLPDLGAAFASGGIYPIRNSDQNLQWLSREYSTDKLDEVLRWARTPA